MEKIKYKIIAEHKDKGIIEIPISKRLLHGIADIPFMVGDCKQCNETFKLNKIDKEVNKFFDIILFLAFDVDSDGYSYQMIEPKNKKDKNKKSKIKFKKVKSNFILIKKPKWKKK